MLTMANPTSPADQGVFDEDQGHHQFNGKTSDEAAEDFQPLLLEDQISSSSLHKDADRRLSSCEDGFDEEEKSEDCFPEDLFAPLDGIAEDGSNIITMRAVTVGIACGALVNASNVYLGLKTGWAASANIFAVRFAPSLQRISHYDADNRDSQSIIGYALLKETPSFLTCLPCLRETFGPRENNIVQTVATAAGGMSNVFTSAFPAMYQLGLLDGSPSQNFWRMVALVAVGGYFGLFFATPCKRYTNHARAWPQRRLD